MPAPISIFKTPELEKQYFEAYEAVLTLWSVSYEPMDVPTSFGITHLNACGSNDKSSIVLLPGFGANSTMWFPNITALSSAFRVYALDTPGQPGRSLPEHRLTTTNCSDWLVQVFDGLGLEKAHLAGISLGGWLALHYAIHKPERVSRLVLIDPAASFEKVSAAFFWHSFMPIMVHPTRAGLIKYFRWMTRGYHVNEKWGELMMLGILNIHPQPPLRAIVFTNEELHRVKTPVMLLIGGQSVIYDPKRVYRRAIGMISNLEAEIIPDASHALNAEKSEFVNARILQFCRSNVEV
jgi:pimeloyl-ACP methyl ester carboxylesterase